MFHRFLDAFLDTVLDIRGNAIGDIVFNDLLQIFCNTLFYALFNPVLYNLLYRWATEAQYPLFKCIQDGLFSRLFGCLLGHFIHLFLYTFFDGFFDTLLNNLLWRPPEAQRPRYRRVRHEGDAGNQK